MFRNRKHFYTHCAVSPLSDTDDGHTCCKMLFKTTRITSDNQLKWICSNWVENNGTKGMDLLVNLQTGC